MKKTQEELLRAEYHTNELTKMLLIDDHVSFRQVLARVLEREPEFKVVGEAGSLAEVRGLSGESLKDVDVAVVDLALPDGDSFGLIEYLALDEPQVITMVLSGSLEPGRFARAIEAGAAGVLDKATPIKDIIEAIKHLKVGEALLSRAEILGMLSLLSRERQQKQAALQAIERLTSREREILRALAEGLESKQIAQKLNIAVETERSHVVNILHKLGVHSRLQALLFAVRHGLVEIR
jgi:two-component system, NarL family, nitrate/nitrite response regulator NarL